MIELGQVTGTVPALVAASSDAAAAIGLGRSKGRLRRGYDADVIVVDGDAADLTALRHVRQVVLRGVPASPRSGSPEALDRGPHPGAHSWPPQEAVTA